jgi:hypothetical protein
MNKSLLLISLTILGSLACESNDDCLHTSKCIDNKCHCDYLFSGEKCDQRPQMELWTAYRVFGVLAHFAVIIFALYQLRRLVISKSGLTTNMVTVELSSLAVASLRKYDNLTPLIPSKNTVAFN